MVRFDKADASRNLEESRSDERRKAFELRTKLSRADEVRRKISPELRSEFDRRVHTMESQLRSTEKMLNTSERERAARRKDILNRKSINHAS